MVDINKLKEKIYNLAECFIKYQSGSVYFGLVVPPGFMLPKHNAESDGKDSDVPVLSPEEAIFSRYFPGVKSSEDLDYPRYGAGKLEQLLMERDIIPSLTEMDEYPRSNENYREWKTETAH